MTGLILNTAEAMALEFMPSLASLSHVNTWEIHDSDTGLVSAIACAFQDDTNDGCGIRTVVSVPIAKVFARAGM